MKAAYAAEIVELAARHWGEPNKALSTRAELRFGTNGSKSLKMADGIWYDHEANVGGGYRDMFKAVHGVYPTNGKDHTAAFRAPAGMAKELGNPVTWWDYHDAAGANVLRVVRFEPSGADKTFRQCRPDGDRWVWKLNGLKTPLYHLPELLGAAPDSTIFIPEGEKHADLIRAWGFLATTNAAGAKKFRRDHAQVLAAFDCVVLPDHDDAGREHEAVVTRELRAAGCTSIRILNLPDLPPKGDIIDWVKAGGTREAFVQLAADARPAPEKTKSNGPVPDDADDPQAGVPFPDVDPDVPAEPKAKKKKRAVVNALALVNYIEARWSTVIRINLFTENMTVSEPFPPSGAKSGKWRQFSEPADQLEAMLYFQNNGFPRAGKGVTMDALLSVGHRNAFHPVADYLASLKWDGEKRLAKLFRKYFNAEIPTNAEEAKKKLAYLEHTGQCFMVSAIARIRTPGCKVDHLPVLVGNQGFNKSRAIRALCRDEAWFSDDLSPDLVDKDTKDSLVGKWLIELAELPHVRKEVERVKAFFSRQTDRYRRAYDRMTSDWPRQCVFMGSSNDLEFIDTTGNRRFWPVEIAGSIDVEPIERDRDQLWAEAVHMFDAGFQWWLPPEIEAIAGEEQERFLEEDIWISQFESWLAGRKEGSPFTLAAAMCGAFDSLFQNPNAITKADQMRASGCLKSLGYQRRFMRVDGSSPRWLWTRRKR